MDLIGRAIAVDNHEPVAIVICKFAESCPHRPVIFEIPTADGVGIIAIPSGKALCDRILSNFDQDGEIRAHPPAANLVEFDDSFIAK